MFNFLKKKQQVQTQTSVVKYKTDSGEVMLSPGIIKRYLVSGNPERVTDQEVMMFLKLCQYQHLNPFLREAYLIKYGDESATLVTSKDVFIKRASNSKLIKGWSAGIIVQKGKEIIERTGTYYAPDEILAGGWAEIWRKDWTKPIKVSVKLSEYQRYKKDGTLMRNWREKGGMPATMIRKVALNQGLREALPKEFEKLYSPEEMPLPIEVTELSSEPIEIKKEDLVIAEIDESLVNSTKKTPTKKPQEKSKSKSTGFDRSKLNKEAKPKWTFNLVNGKKIPQPPPIIKRLYAIAKEVGLDKNNFIDYAKNIAEKEHFWEFTFGDIFKIEDALREVQSTEENSKEELSPEEQRALDREFPPVQEDLYKENDYE